MSGFTVWWWDTRLCEGEHGIPVPAIVPDVPFAVAIEKAWRESREPTVRWVKMFRSGDETDVRARYDGAHDEWVDLSPTARLRLRELGWRGG